MPCRFAAGRTLVPVNRRIRSIKHNGIVRSKLIVMLIDPCSKPMLNANNR